MLQLHTELRSDVNTPPTILSTANPSPMPFARLKNRRIS